MIFVIDADDERTRIGIAGRGGTRWTACGPKEVVGCFANVVPRPGRPSGIVAVIGGEGRRATWSAVRAAVAASNALAFAWGVPAVAVERGSDDDDATLVSRAATALAGASASARVSAVYDGEPNITAPRSER